MSLIQLVYLSSVLINIAASSSDVCKVVTVKNSIFKKGKRLNGFQFYRLTKVPDALQCARNCFFRRRCLSFNYNEKSTLCEFNNARVDPPYVILNASTDYVYSDFDDWDEAIGMGPCWNRPCGICEACYPTETNYTCVKEELTSCRDIKICTNTSSDDHYLIRPVMGTKPFLKIYCYEMASNYPKDYLTLHEDNYSRYPPIHSQSCSNIYWKGAGVTFYKKIRLDITSLRVVRGDEVFANLSCDPKYFGISDPMSFKNSGEKCTRTQKYGVAADCVAIKCPRKGEFIINLTGTGLIVPPSVKWKPNGYSSSISSITRSSSNEVVKGVCGGNCGKCGPEGGLLILEPIIPNI